MENEIWKSIEETNGRYEVSNMGKVRNTRTGKVLKPYVTRKGYHRVDLYPSPHKYTHVLIHRLVAKYFCAGYKDGLYVNHIDGNKSNNVYTNLEWVTALENVEHSFKEKLHHNPRTPVVCIDTVKMYPSTREASRNTGIPHGNISRACKGKYKTAGGYTWRYTTNSEVSAQC